MNTTTENRTIGSDPESGLVLEGTTISAHHATLELTGNGLVFLVDNHSDNGTFLNRNDRWIRVMRITLCIGDSIRLGDVDVPLQRIMAQFADSSGARLEKRPFAALPDRKGGRTFAHGPEAGALLKKPKRNALTGKIEEQSN